MDRVAADAAVRDADPQTAYRDSVEPNDWHRPDDALRLREEERLARLRRFQEQRQ